jgi:PHD finger-like domain-containing protein 5A
MATHHGDLILCRKQPGINVGRVCERHDGICPICDSLVRPGVRVRICDECSFGSLNGKCMICQAPGTSDAYYCQECVQLEVCLLLLFSLCYIIFKNEEQLIRFLKKKKM